MRVSCILILLAATLSAESVAGLRWTTPAGWKSEGSRPMRAATYTFPEKAECAVYFFGAGGGGSVQANLDRWKDQVHGPAAKIAKRTIHGLPVTTIDASGEYTGMGGAPVPGYRLIGAIVEGPGGNVFVKFTGPQKVLLENQQKFEQLLASFAVAKPNSK